jgi:hypothetical protein
MSMAELEIAATGLLHNKSLKSRREKGRIENCARRREPLIMRLTTGADGARYVPRKKIGLPHTMLALLYGNAFSGGVGGEERQQRHGCN